MHLFVSVGTPLVSTPLSPEILCFSSSLFVGIFQKACTKLKEQKKHHTFCLPNSRKGPLRKRTEYKPPLTSGNKGSYTKKIHTFYLLDAPPRGVE